MPQRIFNFSEIRKNRLDDKRRKTERIFFKQVLGVYCVIGDAKPHPVELVDVSEEGCAFQVPFNPNKPWPDELQALNMRLYFSQDTYLPVRLRIKNSRPYIEQGVRYIRFGCEVDQSFSSYEAYKQFIKFLGLYSEHVHKDEGNVTLFYL